MRDIQNTRGEKLPVDIDSYNQCRRPQAVQHLKTLCHAPFVSMDFGPQGEVSVCNHYHKKIGTISDTTSFEEVWNGIEYGKLRTRMLNYIIDEDLCRQCGKQIRAGKSEHTFAIEHYDMAPSNTDKPRYPVMMTFRLANTCNLACIMCKGDLSSRICIEREKRSIPPSPYGDVFFEKLRTILPKLSSVEFFGGEPFLVKEHIRIFELMKEVGAKCSIYVNTNGMLLTDRVKGYLEDLNFTCIAISMDGVNPLVNEGIRKGVDQEQLLRNLEWYLELRKRKSLIVLLNVTELRQNWFELPELFRFAAEKKCALHINTCIHPSYCTLYNLPSSQLNHVFEFLEKQREELERTLLKDRPQSRLKFLLSLVAGGLRKDKGKSEGVLAVKGNRQSYDYLLSMIRAELERRTGGPPIQEPAKIDEDRYGTDGLLAAPFPGSPPFETPEKVWAEIERTRKNLGQSGQHLIDTMVERIRNLSQGGRWKKILKKIEQTQEIGDS
ncbi:MAG: radical SAM protein [Candidatus Electrothrix sp.]